MKSRKGYLLLEGIVSLIIIVIICISIFSFLSMTTKYSTSIQDKIELYEQSEEMYFQINNIIEGSSKIINVETLDGKKIDGKDNINVYTNVKSIKCKYTNEDDKSKKDREISYKNNHKLFINTLNNYGSSESGGTEIGDYVDNIAIMLDKNKVSIKLTLSKNKEKYETIFKSYIKEF